MKKNKERFDNMPRIHERDSELRKALIKWLEKFYYEKDFNKSVLQFESMGTDGLLGEIEYLYGVDKRQWLRKFN